ncbi:hypothetical protein [Thioalkalivibrio sp. ARh3]|uniref:hypothetical protein n=1 Tax=Thioalkalivibrio sp. ARh3 TaxID=1158148 RepID=UPI00037DEEF0|nr:hypothetical protein [Thioalkalivibrio sp. ARh3]
MTSSDRLYLGIDPGATGCLALLDADGGYIDHLLMPTIKIGSRNRVNGAAVAHWLQQSGEIAHAFLERVQSMPKQGVASTFSFGHSAGLVEGVVAGAGIPLTLVTPQRWKKHAGLIGSDKDAARSRAVQLYPGLRALDAKGKGQALADALLIGRYGVGAPE